MHERVKIFSYHVTNVFGLIQQIRYNYDKPRGGIKNITLYAKFRNLNFFCYEMYNSFLDIFARIHQYGASMIYSKVTRNSKKWKLLKRLRCFSTITFQMSVLLPLNLFDFFFFFFFFISFSKDSRSEWCRVHFNPLSFVFREYRSGTFVEIGSNISLLQWWKFQIVIFFVAIILAFFENWLLAAVISASFTIWTSTPFLKFCELLCK